MPPGVEARDTQRIRIDGAERELALVREAEGWRLVEPVEDLASRERVERLLDTLDVVEVMARLPEAELESPLGEPAARVLLEGESVRTLIELFDLQLAGSHVYARINGAGELLLVPLSLVEELAPRVSELRRELALPYSSDEVARFEIRNEEHADLAFERDARGWRVALPYSDQADASRVGALLDAVLALRADSFLAEAEEDSRPGESPWLTFSARKGADESLARLEILGRSGEAPARRWARVEGRPGALRVDARALARQLTGDPERYRSLLVLDFASSELRELRFESGERRLQLERSSADSPWVETESDRELDQARVNELVFQLARVEASAVCASCVPDAVTRGARLELRAFGSGSDPPPFAVLEIYPHPEDEGLLLVRREAGGPLLVVPTRLLAIPDAASLTVSKLSG
jgi:hypothetical protein